MLAHSQNHLDKRIYQELKFCEFGYCQQLTKRYLRRWKYRRNRHFRPLQSKSISQAVHFFSSSTHYPPNKSGPVPSLRQKTCNLKISKLNSVQAEHSSATLIPTTSDSGSGPTVRELNISHAMFSSRFLFVLTCKSLYGLPLTTDGQVPPDC